MAAVTSADGSPVPSMERRTVRGDRAARGNRLTARHNCGPPAATRRSHDFGSFAATKFLSRDGSAKITGSSGLDATEVTASFRKWTTQDHGPELI
jgi:hypothetical protein